MGRIPIMCSKIPFVKENLDDWGKTLEKDYRVARSFVPEEWIPTLDNFEKVIQEKSFAVKNVEVRKLGFIASEKVIRNYYSTEKGKQKTEDLKREGLKSRRMEVDEALFGCHGEKVHYAALSLELKGLCAYGKCCLHLSEEKIKESACLLKQNSFQYLLEMGNNFLFGHRAIWQDRHKLAVAKLATKVVGQAEEHFASILLIDRRKKDDDDFIEVHIFGESTLSIDYIKRATLLCAESELTDDDKTALGVFKDAIGKDASGQDKWV